MITIIFTAVLVVTLQILLALHLNKMERIHSEGMEMFEKNLKELNEFLKNGGFDERS